MEHGDGQRNPYPLVLADEAEDDLGYTCLNK
jgi:hypothetical protein